MSETRTGRGDAPAYGPDRCTALPAARRADRCLHRAARGLLPRVDRTAGLVRPGRHGEPARKSARAGRRRGHRGVDRVRRAGRRRQRDRADKVRPVRLGWPHPLLGRSREVLRLRGLDRDRNTAWGPKTPRC